MGLTRKVTSASTLGAVDFRSDKERIARSTRQGAKATKKQNKLIAEQNDLLAQQAAPAPYVQQPQYVAPAPPPRRRRSA
ncbi:hypothetical protein [Gordonia sp. FQ]|uniref:hypothetical protein n=1 Tax=Gordonia sp. FQ TaxID=3446634 RepID=UPI003F839FB3